MANEVSASSFGNDTYITKGKASFPDGFRYKIMDIKGKLDFQGAGSVGDLSVSGKTKGVDLSGDNLRFKGSVELNKVTANQVTIKGACKIQSIKSSSFEIIFTNISHVQSIESTDIVIKPVSKEERSRNINIISDLLTGSWINKFSQFINIDKIKETLQDSGSEFLFILESVKGQNIYLENVSAELVEGKNITIGPNCIIGKTINL